MYINQVIKIDEKVAKIFAKLLISHYTFSLIIKIWNEGLLFDFKG